MAIELVELQAPRILVVDDEKLVLSSLRRSLSQLRPDCEVVAASDPLQAMRFARTISFDLVISDLRMPRIDGVALLRLVKREQPLAIRVILSGQANADTLLAALPLSHRYLEKPSTGAELRELFTVVDTVANIQAPRTLIKHLIGLTSLPADGGSIECMEEALEQGAASRELVRLLRTDLAVQVAELRLERIALGHPVGGCKELTLSADMLGGMMRSKLLSPVTTDHSFMMSLRALAIKSALLADAIQKMNPTHDARGVAFAAYLGELGLLSLVGADHSLIESLRQYRAAASALLMALWGFSPTNYSLSQMVEVQQLMTRIDEILPYSEVEQLSSAILYEILSEVVCSVDS